ncbi:MAG: hypothetical protein HZA50_10365 [Planctomycetes bacterium]|nr:hypothetical protein [Planctomycetota bacterium]
MYERLHDVHCFYRSTYPRFWEVNHKISKSTPPELTDIYEQVKSDSSSETDSRIHHKKRINLLIEKVGTNDKKRLTQLYAKMDLISYFNWNKWNIYSLADRLKASRLLAETTLAMAAYKADNGNWPETLEKLVPKYLPAVPNDPFVDQPLKYRKDEKGWVLYSVGENMKDDGGKKTEDPAAGKEDDICVKSK